MFCRKCKCVGHRPNDCPSPSTSLSPPPEATSSWASSADVEMAMAVDQVHTNDDKPLPMPWIHVCWRHLYARVPSAVALPDHLRDASDPVTVGSSSLSTSKLSIGPACPLENPTLTCGTDLGSEPKGHLDQTSAQKTNTPVPLMDCVVIQHH